jgi:hypothetical protein
MLRSVSSAGHARTRAAFAPYGPARLSPPSMSKLELLGRAFAAGALLGPSAHAIPVLDTPQVLALATDISERPSDADGEAHAASLAAEANALTERWAPVFVQHTSSEHPERDRPLPIDFDGDWLATNNWQDLTPAAAYVKPVVYGSAILTSTHAFLTYTLFYPRDWQPYVCFSYACHDNDLEVLLVVVERGPETEGADRVVLVETKAHRSFVPLRGADVARSTGFRPLVEVESQGHGMYAMERGSVPAAGYKLFVPQSAVGMAPSPSGELMEHYELASLHDTLWRRRSPSAERGQLWNEGETGWLAFGGARAGRLGSPMGASMAGTVYDGGVRPPWALRAVGERGDWFLDPVVPALGRHGGWFAGRPLSRTYVFNPYITDLKNECAGRACSSAPSREPKLAFFPVLLAAILALGLASRGIRRPDA